MQENGRIGLKFPATIMDAFGTAVFTGGVVLALGSFFTQVFELIKERGNKKSPKYLSKNIMDKCIRTSPMQVVVGGAVF